MRKFLVSLPLAAALLVPMTSMADDHDHRYYDAEHHDYHQWNAHEDRAYHRYWEDRHEHYVDWAHANAEQRRAYWRWRHEHSDAVLFGVEVH